jgi:hypothetical protein
MLQLVKKAHGGDLEPRRMLDAWREEIVVGVGGVEVGQDS